MRRAIVAALLLLPLLYGGCGGGGETGEAKLTKAQFIARADAICKQTEERQEAAVKAFAVTHPQAGGLAEESTQEEVVLAAGLPPLRRQVKELRDLEPPAEGAEAAAAYLQAVETAISKGEADPRSMLEPSTNPFIPAEELARSFGFRVCAGA